MLINLLGGKLLITGAIPKINYLKETGFSNPTIANRIEHSHNTINTLINVEERIETNIYMYISVK